MSEEMKKGILDKEYSRRQFLKMSGKGLAGISMTAAMLSLFGCTQKQVEEGVVDLIATPTALLVANRAKCTGCQRCETNCTLTNDGKAQPYLARLRVRDSVVFGAEEVPADYMHGGGFLGEWDMGPETCKQCADPACVKACGFGALAAGLLSASGVGVLVLFRANPRPRENLAVLGLVWGTGGAVGLILQLLG